MKPRDPTTSAPSSTEPETPGAAAPRRSGRVQFDGRGQAVWEWAVRTGKFDRNASTQRIKALVETPLSLSEEPAPAAQRDGAGAAAAPPGSKRAAPGPTAPSSLRPVSGNPYERADPPATLRPGESAGSDPYGRGPSRPRGGR